MHLTSEGVMEYLIIYQGQTIAKITHPEADVGQGIVIGPFLPFPAYESVRAVFQISGQLIAAELESGRRNEGAWQQYYQQRDVLTQRLSITTLDDLPVETTWIDILDCSEDMGDDGYEAHFVVATPEFFKDVLLWDQKTGKNDVPFSS